MFKKISLFLLIISCTITVAQAQQKMKTNDIIGTWKVTAILSDDMTIPVDSEKSLWDFMSAQMGAGKDSVVLTSEDSTAIKASIKVLGMFSESTVMFKADKTFNFTLVLGPTKDNKTGTWTFDEATQTVKITEPTKEKASKSEIIKILVKGEQLLIQMEKDKEEGFLVSRVK